MVFNREAPGFAKIFRCLIAVLPLFTACSDLTRVTAPDVVQEGSLNNSSGATLLRNGAITSFNGAYAEQALLSGMLSDEFSDRSGGQFKSDQRIVPPIDPTSSVDRYPYSDLSAARIAALHAISTTEKYDTTEGSQVGAMFAYLAATELFFVEDLCSGVPVGLFSNGAAAPGPVLDRQGLIVLALQHLDSAAAHGTASDSVENWARVLRARALLDSNNVQGATITAAQVPDGFEYVAQFGGSAVPYNIVAYWVYSALYASVSDNEGGNGLDFVSAHDPRVPTQDLGAGAGGGEVFGFALYTTLGSPIVVAGSVEARLIQAEALLRAGQTSLWIQILNNLRTNSTFSTHPDSANPSQTDTVWNAGTGGVSGLSPVVIPASAAAQVDLMFRERAFWLFGTGHRQGDLRRLVRQYGRSVGIVFPSGTYQGGPAQYGTDVTFVPYFEENNPAYHGCENRNP